MIVRAVGRELNSVTAVRAHGWGAPALAAYLTFVLAMLLVNSDSIGGNIIPLLLVAVACGLPFYRAIRSVGFDPVEPIWVYTGIFFFEHFLKPLLTLGDTAGFGCNLFAIDYGTSATPMSLVLAAAGFASFFWGYVSTISKKAVSYIPVIPDKWRPSRVAVAMLLALSGYVATIYYFVAKAGFSMQGAYFDRAQLNAGAGELVFIVHLLGWVSAVILFRSLVRNGWGGTALVSLGACVGIIGAYIVFGARGSLFFIPATLVVLWHYKIRRFGARMIALFFALFFIIFALFAQYRAHLRWSVGSVEELNEAVRLEVANYNNWDIFLGTIQYYPDVKDYYYGRLATSSLMWLIPRRIWPSKPILYGPALVQEDIAPGLRIVVDTGGFSGTTISQSTMGEAYADLGVLGILLYMFIFGAVWGGLYGYLSRCAFSYPASALYAALYVGLPGYTRNFAPSMMNLFIWFVALYGLFLWMGGGLMNKSARNGPEAS